MPIILEILTPSAWWRQELVITANELGLVMRKLGQEVLPNELADMIEDNDGMLKGHGTPDGALDFPEFIHMMAKKLNDPHYKQELQEAFQVFDADGSGYISAKELCNVMNNLGIDLPNDDGTPMNEAEVADLICDWPPPGKDGRRERRPGMSWQRFWAEIQGGDGSLGSKKKHKGRDKLAEETDRLAKKAQVELQQARDAVRLLEGRLEHESAEEFAKRKLEAQDAVTAAEKKVEDLKVQSAENADEIKITRLDLKRFAAQDNLSTHEAVRVGAAQLIEKTMRTRAFLGTRFLTTDAAQMARRFSIRVAVEAGMDKSGAVDLNEIKGALQEFDRYGDQSVFVQELGMVCEVLARRPVKGTLNPQVETVRDTKLDPNAPWCCVGTPPWNSGAAGCRCSRPVKSVDLAVDRSAPFVGCEHDANNLTISIGSDGCAANPQARHEKHTSKCLQARESWSAFCARRASIHGYGSSSDPRRHRLSWTTGRVPGCSCAFCCVNIKAGAVTHRWKKSADGKRWIEPAEQDEVHERMQEEHGPAGLWAHMFPCGAEWRAGNGFPLNIDALCEDCNSKHARYSLVAHAKQQERLELKQAKALLQDEQLRNHGDADTAEVHICDARQAVALAEKRVRAMEEAERDSRMRWCEACADTHRVQFAEKLKDQSAMQGVENVEANIEREVAKFMRLRKPQKLLQEICRAATAFQAKSHYGDMRDLRLRRRVLEENRSGFTPMHCAARDGKLDCVHALLVRASTDSGEAMVPVGKSVAYTWDPSAGTDYKVDPPQDADRRRGLRQPYHDVWPTSISLPPNVVWCGTQEGQGPTCGRGITDKQVQDIMEAAGAAITVPSGLNTDIEVRIRAETGADAGSGTEAGPIVIEIEGSCTAHLDGCEPPILVARRKLNALRLQYYLNHLRELYATGASHETLHEQGVRVAKDEKQKISDELTHLARTMRVKQTAKQEERLHQLKAEEKEKETVLALKRLVWDSCVHGQKIQAQRIAEVEVDYQIMQPSLFDTSKGAIKLLATKDLMGFTPLHWACRNGHAAVALALIAEGAHPTALSLKGRTPLEEAEAFCMDEDEEAEELAKLNRSSVAEELLALREAKKRRRDCVAELRDKCPLMADEPLPPGTQIFVDGYGHGGYVGLKRKAGGGLCGRGALCALHTVRFTKYGTEQHLHLKEMSWRLSALASSTTNTSRGGASFDELENAVKRTAEPEPPLPGGVTVPPSKYAQANMFSARKGKKLEW